MQLTYGSAFTFDVNSCYVTSTAEALFNDAGKPYSSRQRLKVSGWLTCNGQSDCTSKENALRTALKIAYQDLILKCDDGSNSATVLQNAGSSTGVRIVNGPHFPRADGIEYVGMRQFEFEAEAEYPLPNVGAYLLSFKETLTTWGGGPTQDVFPALNGPPQAQQIYLATPYHATQQGRAVGAYNTPTPPGPKWPFALKEAGRFAQDSPDPRGGSGNVYERFPISWSYEFVSVGPLVGVPNVWTP